MTHITAHPKCKVYTPLPLAEAMARLLPDAGEAEWLEPCVGQGVFLDALNEAGVDRGRIFAVELDTHDGLNHKCGTYLPGTDFLSWAIETDRRFDRVIGNPPYLPLHRVPPDVRAAALRTLRPDGRRTVPPKANCWYAFLCACLGLLRPGGGLCFVLPSAWEYADYAADLRETVSRRFAHVAVYRSENSIFTGVLDGCVVLVAAGYGGIPGTPMRRTFRTGDELLAALASTTGPVTTSGERTERPPPSALVQFGDVARVRIGGVTGESGYFLLTETERIARGLPRSSVRPVVTRARHVIQSAIRSVDWRAIRDADERVWLFSPGESDLLHPAVAKYLKCGQDCGVPARQKVKAREPWYRTRLPPRPDGVMSGMTPYGPWVCLNRTPGLSATNTLYTVHFHRRLPHAMRASWALSLLSSHVAAQHATLGRRYSDGLLKFEPRDVMNLVVPVPPASSEGAEIAYQKAVRALLGGNPNQARAIADEHVLGNAERNQPGFQVTAPRPNVVGERTG